MARCTDGTRVPLHERVVYCAAWHAAETLPNVPNPPSPFRAHLADKIVLDIWGGRVRRHRAATWKHCMITGWTTALPSFMTGSAADTIMRFPAHVPANARLGGDAGMKNLVATAKRLGYDIALHENYVDYYPNYEGFNPGDVSLDSNSNRVHGLV